MNELKEWPGKGVIGEKQVKGNKKRKGDKYLERGEKKVQGHVYIHVIYKYIESYMCIYMYMIAQ